MDVTVRQHINRLQRRLEALNEEIMRSSLSHEERNKLESDIRAVSLALSHYQAALAIEKGVGI